jgi:type II secretory ATPase GspE/PulE/Tfp pilus assembly ATPase PilB-like protein
MEEGKDYSLVRYIQRRIKNNKNFLATITGPTGSGKSWSALSMAKLIDPTFTADRVIFRARELMKLINEGNLGAGSVIVWDEAGIDLSNRNWQSVTNKMLNALLQTFRHKNFILFFTVPYHDFIDSASKKLFHADFETQRINKNQGLVIIKPKLLQYNSNLSKWYRKYLKVQINNKIVKIKRWAVPRPDEELVRAYESRKNLFTQDLNKDIDNQLKELEPEVINEVKVEEDNTKNQAMISTLDNVDNQIWELHQQGKSLRQIAEVVGLDSATSVRFRLQKIIKKNQLLQNYKSLLAQQTPANNLTSEVTRLNE